jgi:hypothetical protein
MHIPRMMSILFVWKQRWRLNARQTRHLMAST